MQEMGQNNLLSKHNMLCHFSHCPGSTSVVSLQVGLVPTAMGGTNLFDQWAPGNELWRNMCDDTAAAMQALGGRGRLRGVIWIQVRHSWGVTHALCQSAQCTRDATPALPGAQGSCREVLFCSSMA